MPLFFTKNDWKKSRAHLFLLSLFLNARQLSSITDGEWGYIWNEKLSENPKKSLNNFIKDGLLIPADTKSIFNLQFTLPELKEICRKHNLPVSGRKNIIIDRVFDGIPNNQLSNMITIMDAYICSDKSRGIAENFQTKENDRRNLAEQQTYTFLIKRNFLEAARVRALFESQCVFPAGIGIDWKNRNLKEDEAILFYIYSDFPNYFRKKSIQLDNSIRLISGMFYLWGEQRVKKFYSEILNIKLKNYDQIILSRMMYFYGSKKSSIERYKKESNIIKGVRISSAWDCCSECKKIEDKEYQLSDVPELPYENCISEQGCRCTYGAVTKSYEEIFSEM